MPPSPNGTHQVAIFIIHLSVDQIQRTADKKNLTVSSFVQLNTNQMKKDEL
jgi:hypothetical protein